MGALAVRFLGFLSAHAEVIFGWALGIATTAFGAWLKGRKDVRAIRRGVDFELREIAHRLLVVVYQTAERRGQLDEPLLQWALPRFEAYEGPNQTDGVVRLIRALLAGPETQRRQLNEHSAATAPSGIFSVSIDATYTTKAVAELERFDQKYAARLVDILAQIRTYNDLRENSVFYERKTLDGLDPVNDQIVKGNADAGQTQLAKRARYIVEKIGELRVRHSA